MIVGRFQIEKNDGFLLNSNNLYIIVCNKKHFSRQQSHDKFITGVLIQPTTTCDIHI